MAVFGVGGGWLAGHCIHSIAIFTLTHKKNPDFSPFTRFCQAHLLEKLKRRALATIQFLNAEKSMQFVSEYSKHKSKKHHRQFIISMMQAKIIALDPLKISDHVATPQPEKS